MGPVTSISGRVSYLATEALSLRAALRLSSVGVVDLELGANRKWSAGTAGRVRGPGCGGCGVRGWGVAGLRGAEQRGRCGRARSWGPTTGSGDGVSRVQGFAFGGVAVVVLVRVYSLGGGFREMEDLELLGTHRTWSVGAAGGVQSVGWGFFQVRACGVCGCVRACAVCGLLCDLPVHQVPVVAQALSCMRRRKP